MDSYEATKVVFSRIQALDPENASKITGYVLIQEHGEKEMIRLAFGPESLLHALIHKAKTHLGISSNTSSAPSTPSSPFSPISIPSPRLNTPSLPSPLSVTVPPSPLPPSSSATMWQHFSPKSAPSSASSPSYAAVVNGAGNNSNSTNSSNGSSSSDSAPPPPPQSHLNISDDYNFQEHLSFLNESSSSSSKNLDLLDAVGSDSHITFPYCENHTPNNHLRRPSLSLSDACCGNFEDCGSGFGWKPCLYFARGFCKNGTSCKFVHSSFGDTIDSPTSVSKFGGIDQCEEILRSRIMAPQQQRLAAAAASHLMAGVSSFPYNKGMNFLMSDKRTAAAAALMMGDEFQKLGLYWPQRRDIYAMGIGGNVNPGSRQIYLTFPADSTFREEDVSNYFSIYGPVQDVRIPFQQKRMFGFVTFVYPETVKFILAKGNPHFVCDSRVLVKPYKEKGKVPDKKQLQQQQGERGEFSTCSSPSGFDSRDPYELHLGARMFYNSQEMLRRKLEEQADLQQAIELRSRRLMNLQFMDLPNHPYRHHHHPLPQQYSHNSVTLGVPTPTQPPSHSSETLILPSADKICQEVATEENDGPAAASTSPTAQQELNAAGDLSDGNGSGNSEQQNSNSDGCDIIHESNLEHILPDSLFASPEKPASDRPATFSTALVEPDEETAGSSTTTATTTTTSNANPLMSTTSTLTMAAAAKNACSFHMPRFSSADHGAIEM